MRIDPGLRRELTWLGHPVTLAALVLLVLNDHVLKRAYGTWWTGKLSDVAWLLVVPPLLSVVVASAGIGAGRGIIRRRLVCVVAVGAVFVVTKTSDLAASVASTALTTIAGPSLVRADVTDLWALPALAVAVLIGRRAGLARTTRRAADLSLLAVLPIAVLATAATSSTGPVGPTEIGVVDGTVWVGQTEHGGGPRYATWFASSDGRSWHAIGRGWGDDESAEQVAARFVNAGGTATTACVPAEVNRCYRVGSSRLSIERSDDGGETWATDWAVPEEQVDELAGRYEGESLPLQTAGLAVLPSRDGFIVVAANGGDGLAVRDEGGAWTRTGFSYRSADVRVVPLPGQPTPMSHPVSLDVLLGVAAGLLVALGWVVRRERRDRGVVRGAWFLTAAAALCAAALAVDLRWGVVAGQPFGATLVLGFVIQPACVALLLVAAVVLLERGAWWLRGPRGAWLTAAAGLTIGLIAFVASWQLALLVAAGLVLVAGAYRGADERGQDDEARGGLRR